MNYTCSTCRRIFESIEVYNKHSKSNKCKEPYECKACNYITKKKDHFSKHLNTQKCKKNTSIELEKEVYKCSYCQKTFRDSYVLSRHLNKKFSCIKAGTTITNNTIQNSHNTNNTNNVTTNNNVIIHAHDPSAFLKELNKVDKSIYHHVLGAYSINSPESIERLNDIASNTRYRKPTLINPEEYPSDEEEDIHNANNERLKEENSKYLSNVFCKAFLDNENLEYMPFLRVPNTNKFKVKFNNQLCEFDFDIVGSLIDIMKHKMEMITKEKNISLWAINRKINEVYSEFRDHFIKKLKQYRYDNKRIR